MMSDLVVGLHGFSADKKRLLHDTGVCLVENGRVISAINEERITRIKGDGSFPHHSLKNVFETNQVNANNIKAVAFADKKSIWQTFYILKNIFKTYRETSLFLDKYLLASLKRAFDYRRTPPAELADKPRYFIEHHLCHAASAYYNCPWDDVTIVTLDGMGDYCIGGTINTAENGKITTIHKTNGFYSPGLFYMFITCLLGYKAGRHEGKITGLAAFGNPDKCYDAMRNMISYNSKKHNFYSYQVPFELKNAVYKGGNIISQFEQMKDVFLLNQPEDIAAAAQKRLEEVVIDYIQDAIRITKKKNLVLAGGVFANVKLNGLISNLSEINDIYIHPNMGDGGLAVGAALYVYNNFLRKKNTSYEPSFLETVYLGPEYKDKEILEELEKHALSYEYCHNIEEKIADAIYQGKIVGNFGGRMEYGPRALGNRSILAAPIDAAINTILNKRLKRTEFMPFAPSVLEEHAKEIFPDWNITNVSARFMTLTYKVAEQYRKKIPAVVHVDNTARPHIVKKQDNERFHKIICEYNKLSGIPVIVNTSFNMHEEPIVCTPQDAIKALLENCVDILAIGNYWVEKNKNI